MNVQKVKIDFDNPGLPQHITAMENDSQSRFFEATLYEGGKAYVMPDDASCSIMYRGFGPQNQGWYDTVNDGAGSHGACTVSGNVVTCEIVRQALQVPGNVDIVLCITASNGYMLKSWPILCDCVNDGYDSTVEVESYFYVSNTASWLTYVYDCQAARDKATAAATASSTSASEAEKSASKAQEALKNVAQYVGGNIVGGDILTLQAAQWTQTTGAYPWTYTAPLTACKSSYLPTAVVVPDSISVAYSAGLSWTCESLDGSVQFWSKNRPTKDIDVQVSMLIPKNTQSTSILGSAILGRVELG